MSGVGPLEMSFAAVAALPHERQDGTLISSSLHAPVDLKAYDCGTWNRCCSAWKSIPRTSLSRDSPGGTRQRSSVTEMPSRRRKMIESFLSWTDGLMTKTVPIGEQRPLLCLAMNLRTQTLPSWTMRKQFMLVNPFQHNALVGGRSTHGSLPFGMFWPSMPPFMSSCKKEF